MRLPDSQNGLRGMRARGPFDPRFLGALGGLWLLALWASCTFDASGLSMEGVVLCGNGVQEGNEYCDGADLGGASCASLNLVGGTLYCNPDCTFNVSACEQTAQCGNGQVEGGEGCDDGNTQDGDGCDHLCQVEGTAQCGDGHIDPGEECDDGNTDDQDACLSNCRAASCGDGHVQTGVELCEQGVVGVTCENLGYASGTPGCNADCKGYDVTNCLRRDGQECDDPSQCEGGVCLDEPSTGWPGGTCTRSCDPQNPDPCLGSGVCLSTGSGPYLCFQRCAETSECRASYACFGVPNSSLAVCQPHCEADGDCPGGTTCNLNLGLCNTSSSGSRDFGAYCNYDTDCLGYCIEEHNYCTALCSLSDGWCPPGSACVDLANGSMADLGLCLKSCTPFHGDCSAPQYCQSIDGHDVCW